MPLYPRKIARKRFSSVSISRKSNWPTVNADKTQFIWLGTSSQLMKVSSMTITLTDVVIQVSDTVTCLGVVIDSLLTFAENVKKLAGSCFYQLRQLRTVRRSLTTDAATTLVHALISSRVDYCNSVLYTACGKPIFVHSSRFKTQRRDSLLANESLIILPAPCATTSTGCQ